MESKLSINEMKVILGDLVQPNWDDDQVTQLYQALMDESVPIVVVDLAASGFKFGKLDQNYWKPRDRNVI